MKCLQALDELELENELTQKEAESRSNEEREKMEEKKNLVDEMTAQYFEFKKGVAKQAVNSRCQGNFVTTNCYIYKIAEGNFVTTNCCT